MLIKLLKVLAEVTVITARCTLILTSSKLLRSKHKIVPYSSMKPQSILRATTANHLGQWTAMIKESGDAPLKLNNKPRDAKKS